MTTDTHDPSDPHDPSDEIALPAFEDALWAALRTEHADLVGTPIASTSSADEVEVLDPARVLAPAAPPSPRRRARRALAAAAAVVVLGAAAGLALRAGGDGTDEERPVATEPGPTEPTTTTLPDEAQLAADLRDLAATHVVATERWVEGRLVQRTWADDTSGTLHITAYLSDGETPQHETGLATAPDPDVGFVTAPEYRVVDHCVDQWAVWPGPNMSSQLPSLADRLDEGGAIVDGTEVVDGRELLVVRATSEKMVIDPETGVLVTSPTPSTVVQPYNVTYLDPETRHPVRVDPGPVADPAQAATTTFRLLPRDADGVLDLLVAEAPSGYEQVAAVRTDEERALAGCP